MKLSLRWRIVLTLVPLLTILAILGGVAMVLLHHLGGRIEAILRENYDSVVYMERLNEAQERIDSSFQFALAGREQEARQQYAQNWTPYLDNLRKEQNNITLPGEGEQVARLTALTQRYQRQGDAFYKRPARQAERQQDYFGSGGLLNTFKEIKDASGQILRMNQDNMEQASRQARRTARDSLIWFGMGLAVAAILAVWLAWHTIRGILQPIRSVTQSALAIGLGNWDQVLPVQSRDELGQLAEAFNTMARQLRHYRQTDYARLLRAQRTSQATIDSFPEPVLVVDGAGQVEMANPAAQRMLGVAAPPSPHPLPLGGRGRGEGGATPIWQPPEALRQPLLQAVQHQLPYLPEGFDRALQLRVDGREHSFLPRILPIRDPYGNSLGAAVLLEDVTRYRLLDQVKSNLVATVSHEFKTPLTSIRLAVHLLLEETIGPLTPKQIELLLDARDNAERLLEIVNNLLDLARLEQGREPFNLRPEKPGTLLQKAAEAIRPRAEDKEVAVVVEAPDDLPLIRADSQRLGHALGNLLDNALTCTNRGGRIALHAAAEGDSVLLTIADTGRGIPREHLPHVFNKFFRIPGQSQERGTGLGLAIVREIVTAHGGSITCDSDPGLGTTFCIKLPIWSGDRLLSDQLLRDQESVTQ